MQLLELLSTLPQLSAGLALVFGLLIGSFLNVVVYRLPIMMNREWVEQCQLLLEQAPNDQESEPFNLAVPKSRCPVCQHQIRAWENIPVLSYLLLRGRCSACHARISLRYPMVELATGLLSGWVVLHFGWNLITPAALLFTWILISLTLIDYDQQLLPDSLTLPLLWLGLIFNSQGLLVDLNSALWGAVGGYLSLWTVYWAFKLLTGKEGMGYGDFKLLAALGAWMGWQALPLIIILSSLVGACVGIALILFRGRDRSHAIPFGPYLAAAGWIALIWGDTLTAYYWQWVGFTP